MKTIGLARRGRLVDGTEVIIYQNSQRVRPLRHEHPKMSDEQWEIFAAKNTVFEDGTKFPEDIGDDEQAEGTR